MFSKSFIDLFSGPFRNIRRKLLRDLIVIVLFTSGGILTITIIQGSDIRKNIARSHMVQVTDRALDKFKNFYKPVENSLIIAQKWGEAGIFNLADVPSLNAKFIPLLEQLPQVSSLIIADSNKAEYFLTREDRNWLTRSTWLGQQNGRVLWKRWEGADGMVDQWSEKLNYNPISRPWYQGAIKKSHEDKIFWTEPYIFFTKKVPGITGSMRMHPKGDKKTTLVVAFDVLLSDIFKSIAELTVSDMGRAFLFNAKGDVFAAGSTVAFLNIGQNNGEGKKTFFVGAEKLKVALIEDALKAWEKNNKLPFEPIEFKSEKETCWGCFQPLNTNDWTVLIGVAVPESDLLGKINKKRMWVLLPALGILATGILLIVLLLRKYSYQIKDLPKQIIKRDVIENEVISLIKAGESSTLEFKSTMRMNLKTGKMGKEIELAWLKTVVAFMNTDGGYLIIGVDDNGGILGIDIDEFENQDKCRLHFKNLINQHIGLEFSKFLNFDILSIDGKSIILIESERSGEPVFLNTKNEEAFYIRSGPSSVKLSTSKVLKYMEHRK